MQLFFIWWFLHLIHLLRLALGSDFGRAAAVLDLNGDDHQELRRLNRVVWWNGIVRRRSLLDRLVVLSFWLLSGYPWLNILLIGRRHTELGFWIPATYKTDRYERWKGKSKVDQNEEVSDDTGEDEKGPSRFDGGNQRRGVPMGMISTGSSARGFPRTCGKLAHRWNKRAYINFSNRKDAVDD